MTKKIEKRVSETILEKKIPIKIGNETFQVAPPTTATLILVSELVSQLPEIKKTEKPEEILNESLRVAKDCKIIAEIPAVIILGAKNLIQREKRIKKRFLGLLHEQEEIIVDKKRELSDFLLNHLSPKELNKLIIKLLMSLEIGDFFGFTTSLAEINLIKPTKREVGK